MGAMIFGECATSSEYMTVILLMEAEGACETFAHIH